MADSTLDFDGDDDAPQRAMMIRAATVAGWTVGRTQSVVAIRTTKEL